MIYDAIIIGSGGAALSSAISLKQKGLKVLLVSKTSNTASQTAQAQGGINAVINENDSVQNHINDTLKSASNVGCKSTIEFMCDNASDTIKWLDDLGVPFSRDKNNNIAQRALGGASFSRACYSSDYTGLKILHTLFDTALKLEIEFLFDTNLLDIIVKDNEAKGVVVLDIKTGDINQHLASNIIIASGGYGAIYHNYTTNSAGSVGDGLAITLNKGAVLENMEFVQFHPTALKDKFILISESARGEGGFLVTKDGKRFVDELLPRDIVAREIYKKLINKEEVFLDVRHLGLEKILHLMPQEYKLCLDFNSLKMDKELIPITPASHYSMGGIKVNKELQTNIKYLYSVGECSSVGVHGANRLGGNSLLEIVTFGRSLANNICIKNIVQDKIYDELEIQKDYINNLLNNNAKDDFYKARIELGKIMFKNVGLFRDEKNLNIALDFVNNLKQNINNYGINDKSKVYNTNLKEFLEFRNSLDISQVIIKSALYRKESRGAHYRVDFDSINKEFDKSTLYSNGAINE